MLKSLLTLISLFACGLGFLLDDKKPTNDHDLILYLDNVVTNLANLTVKLEKDIATKNDMTQFLQADLNRLNTTLIMEIQKRQTLERKVTQLESSLANEKASNGDLQVDLTSTKAVVKSLQNGLQTAKHQINVLLTGANATKAKMTTVEQKMTNDLAVLRSDLDHMKNETNKRSYFSLRNAMTTLTRGLKFTGVLVNHGNGYNVTTGKFVAPYDGVYTFTLTLGVMTDTFTSCYIVENRFITLVEVFTSVVVGYCSATSSTVVHLVKGDNISVENCHGNGTFSPYKSSFSGSLLYSD